MITYDRYDIVFQEIPNEVSLAFTIQGCPNRCVGCHSPHLWKQGKKRLTKQELKEKLVQYKDLITCVLFLGGDAFYDELYELIALCKDMSYKTAFYSGSDSINGKLVSVLDYYKVGSYKQKYGGLASISTNQRLYKIEDITSSFHIKK